MKVLYNSWKDIARQKYNFRTKSYNTNPHLYLLVHPVVQNWKNGLIEKQLENSSLKVCCVLKSLMMSL